MLASPSDRSSRLGAFLCVNGNSGADEFAVAAKVAGASIVDAALVIRIGIDETVAGGEQGTAHYAAFLKGKRRSQSIPGKGKRLFAFLTLCGEVFIRKTRE